MRILDQRAAPERWLADLDADPGSWRARGLVPFSWLWRAGAAARRALRPDRPLPADPPSLGIGNIRVGGSGKTPVVEDLGRRLKLEGHRVAVLTRGYRGGGGGDEPAWLGDAGLVVYADPDRSRSFERAREAGATRVLLDDALQTRHRARFLAGIVLDRDLVTPPRVLPAGPARESHASLGRADVLFVRRELTEQIQVPSIALGFRLVPAGWMNAGGNAVAQPEGPGMLCSGLARPESFEADAARTGAEVVASWRQSDHWAPDAAEAAAIGTAARSLGATWVVAPEKNLARLASTGLDLPLYALRSRIEWDGESDPLDWLRSRGVAV